MLPEHPPPHPPSLRTDARPCEMAMSLPDAVDEGGKVGLGEVGRGEGGGGRDRWMGE